ncbi:MAG: hypothetical protein MO846_04980 [Candidatus Devosia symbiotica]|nr:hypothetical protein [Candidatus Devosia symbiotica]
MTISGVEGGQHQIDCFAISQILGDLAGPHRIRLRVGQNQLDSIALIAHLHAICHIAVELLDEEKVALTEHTERAGARADKANPNGLIALDKGRSDTNRQYQRRRPARNSSRRLNTFTLRYAGANDSLNLYS